MENQLLINLQFELKRLQNNFRIYNQQKAYIYANVYNGWVKRFNEIITKYNTRLDISLQPFYIDDWFYSSTGKTMREEAFEVLTSEVSSMLEKIEFEIESKRKGKVQETIPFHQVRKCFKLGVEKCPHNPGYDKNKVFIGMPFDDEYTDSYKYGLKPALDSLGYKCFRADNEISNRDIMCKVCQEIQTCGLIIINISGLNPNVMLELGIAYGIGKPVIIIKDTKTKTITDLGSIEYLEYKHAYDLQQKLVQTLESDII